MCARCNSTYFHGIRALYELIVTLKRCDIEKTRAAADEVGDDTSTAVQKTERVRTLLHGLPICAAAFGINLLRLVENAEQLPDGIMSDVFGDGKFGG